MHTGREAIMDGLPRTGHRGVAMDLQRAPPGGHQRVVKAPPGRRRAVRRQHRVPRRIVAQPEAMARATGHGQHSQHEHAPCRHGGPGREKGSLHGRCGRRRKKMNKKRAKRERERKPPCKEDHNNFPSFFTAGSLN